VAVDSVARNTNGESTTVYQPLPLPEGVSNYALSGNRAHNFKTGTVSKYAVNEQALSFQADMKEAGEPAKTPLPDDTTIFAQWLSSKITVNDSVDTTGLVKHEITLTINPQGEIMVNAVIPENKQVRNKLQSILSQREKIPAKFHSLLQKSSILKLTLYL